MCFIDSWEQIHNRPSLSWINWQSQYKMFFKQCLLILDQLSTLSFPTKRMTAPLQYDPMLLLNHSIWITNNEMNYKQKQIQILFSYKSIRNKKPVQNNKDTCLKKNYTKAFFWTGLQIQCVSNGINKHISETHLEVRTLNVDIIPNGRAFNTLCKVIWTCPWNRL